MASWKTRIRNAKERGYFSKADQEDIENTTTDELSEFLNYFGIDSDDKLVKEARFECKTFNEIFKAAVLKDDIPGAEEAYNSEFKVLLAKWASPEELATAKLIVKVAEILSPLPRIQRNTHSIIGRAILGIEGNHV